MTNTCEICQAQPGVGVQQITRTFTPPAPATGAAGHWRADDLELAPGAAVAAWPDASDHGRTLTASGAARPTYVAAALNGMPGVRFRASLKQYVTAGTQAGLLAGVGAFTVAAVVAQHGRATGDTQTVLFAATGTGTGGTTRARHGFGASTGAASPGGRRLDTDALASATAGGAPALDAFRISTQAISYAAAMAYAWRDGTQVLSTALPTMTAGVTSPTASMALRIGAQSGTAGFLDGTVCEVLLYDRVLTTLERRDTHAYLSRRWSVPAADDPGDVAYTEVTSATRALCSWCAVNLAMQGKELVVATPWLERPPGVGDMPALHVAPAGVVLYPGAVSHDGPALPPT